jgi:hypothetical protein
MSQIIKIGTYAINATLFSRPETTTDAVTNVVTTTNHVDITGPGVAVGMALGSMIKSKSYDSGVMERGGHAIEASFVSRLNPWSKGA